MKLAVRTPLVPLQTHPNILLKLENLQPYSSYKIRGVCHALSNAPLDRIRHGVTVASAGNMAQAVGYVAQKMGIRATAIVPTSAPKIKKQRIQELGVELIERPFDEVWDLVRNPPQNTCGGYFLHPVFDTNLRLGYGSLIQEILEDCDSISTILVPFGVGGLILGMAETLKKINPEIKIIAVEVETACPLSKSLSKGCASQVDRKPSFIDAIGTPEVLPEVFTAIKPVIDGVIVVSLEEVKSALRTLYFKHRMIAEGAGAASLAAALKIDSFQGKIVSIISGGNIDQTSLDEVLTS